MPPGASGPYAGCMNSTLRFLSITVLAASGFSRNADAGDLDSQSRLLDAAAATRSTHSVAEEVGSRFEPLAGSRENAVKLAKGLYSGKVIALRTLDASGNDSMVAFDLPSGGMTWGEVQATLELTKSTLAKHGVHNPTGTQVQAALLGGTLTKPDGSTVGLEGVVRMRAQGADWQSVTQKAGAASEAVAKTLASAQGRVAQLPVAVTNANGMPIYAEVNEPVIRPSPWAQYRPVLRPSRQIEHETGVVPAGYLR